MIQDSWVCEACVDRAMDGMATFSDDIAATTAARAMQTTAVTAPWRTAGAVPLLLTAFGWGMRD